MLKLLYVRLALLTILIGSIFAFTPINTIGAPPSPSFDIQRYGRVEYVSQVGGTVTDVAYQDGFAFIGKGTRFLVIDLSDPYSPQQIAASNEMPDIVQGVAVLEKTAYVADGGGGLKLFNITDPKNPQLLSTVDMWARGVVVSQSAEKTYAYIVDGDIQIVDVSDPTQPFILKSFVTPGRASGLTMLDSKLYVADGEGGLVIVDVADPSQPMGLGSYVSNGYAYSTAVQIQQVTGKTYVYLAAGEEGGLHIIDVSNPQAPVEATSLSTEGDLHDVVLYGSHAFLANGQRGLLILNITNPLQPSIEGSAEIQGFALGITFQDKFVLIANGSGLTILDAQDPLHPKTISSFEVLGAAYNVVLANNPTAGDGRSYAFVSDYYSGMYVMDISTPDLRPTVTGFYDAPGYTDSVSVLPLPGQSSDPQLQKIVAFVAGPSNGLRIVDVTSPYAPLEEGVYEMPDWSSRSAVALQLVSSGLEQSSNSNTLAYVAAGATGGVRIVDVTNSKNPVEIGFYKTPGDARGVSLKSNEQFAQQGSSQKLLYVADGSSGLRIVDVNDPANPREVGAVDTPGFAESVQIVGDFAFVADGPNGGVRIIDVHDPAQPVEISNFPVDGYAQELTIEGSRLFLANGMGGIRVIDIGEPNRPVEIGSYSVPGYVSSIAVNGNMIYVASRAAGLVVLKFFEPNPLTLAVNSTQDVKDAIPGDGKCATIQGECTLRAAIQEANANVGYDTILIPSGTYSIAIPGVDEDAAASGDFDITDHLMIKGSSREDTIIDGAGLDRVFHVLGGAHLWVEIVEVTIQNGLGGINILQTEDFTMYNTIIAKNQGYGLWASSSNVFLNGCYVSQNVDSNHVGGIGSYSGSLTINDSTIAGNVGPIGGISVDGSLSMLNSTISANQGTSGAGGIYISGNATIYNSTISQNKASQDGGGISSAEGSKVVLKNSIVAGNTSNTNNPDCSGTINSQGYNLFGDTVGFVLQRAEGDLLQMDAKLSPLTSNGNVLPVYHPMPGSPVIDAADPQGCIDLDGNLLVVDELGKLRPVDGNQDGNAICDMGAIEAFSDLIPSP